MRVSYARLTRVVLPGILAALAPGCHAPSPAPARPEVVVPAYFTSPDSVLKGMPFSEAVQVGNLLFISGQIGSVPGTMTLAAGGIGPESRQALENIRAILERRGASLADVVKCTIFLADIGEWGAFNQVYREFFSPPYPARSALGGTALVFGARTEVECIAVVPG
ncbi:MAG TPA: Rid family detoxifying hydrolase [Gemmatimonadales bacterium]|nr:Rid family detoxifying hydrolase [Gemmatimonadales bacterium]